MWNGARIEGPAIRATIAKTFARGVLRWAPVASGVRGDVGFTLGTFSFAPAAGGKGGHGSYCTIWRRQADGAWKVVFDTGRPGD